MLLGARSTSPHDTNLTREHRVYICVGGASSYEIVFSVFWVTAASGMLRRRPYFRLEPASVPFGLSDDRQRYLRVWRLKRPLERWHSAKTSEEFGPNLLR